MTLIESIIEEVLVSMLPEAKLSKEELSEIKRRIKEMKRGNYVTLEEIKGA